jgi:2-(1,2-epoxy-1,2-dihydrophenyl)acetyl-CoA isomerase
MGEAKGVVYYASFDARGVDTVKIQMSQYKHIKFAKEGAIARIELNRPDAANGLDSLMASELKEAARLCDDDPGLKVVTLSANGRFFSAGGDLAQMLSHGDAIGDAAQALADDFHEAISSLSRMQAVLVIAVNGVAAGGGFSLTLIGDIVLAAESASFTMAYTRAGLSPDGASSYFLPRLLGLRKTQELMLTNPTLSATQACELGMITRVVDDADLAAETERLAARIAAGPRLANAYVKKLLLASAGNDLETQMALEAQLLAQCAASHDGREGIQAFFDKRKPEFD